MTMDHVQTKQDGNFQTRFFHRLPLNLVARLSARHVEHGTDAAPCSQFVLIDLDVVGSRGVTVRELRQLAEFLLERHLFEECRHFCVYFSSSRAMSDAPCRR